MKKIIGLLSVFMMALFVTSCNKLPEIEELFGTYQGTADIEENHLDVGENIPMTVLLSQPLGQDKLMLEITMQSIASFPIGKITVNCDRFLSEDKEEYILNGTGTVNHSKYGSFSVNVMGELDKKDLDLKITGTAKGIPIEIEFDGRK